MKVLAWVSALVLVAGLAVYALRPSPLDLSNCDNACAKRLIVAIARHDYSRMSDAQAFDMIQSLALLGETEMAFRLVINKKLMLQPDAVPALRRLALSVAVARDWERLDLLLGNIPDELLPLVIVPSVYKLSQYGKVEEAVALIEKTYGLKPSAALGQVMNATFGVENPTAEILSFWADRRAQKLYVADTDMSNILRLTDLRSRLESGAKVDQSEIEAAISAADMIDHPVCRRHALHELAFIALFRDNLNQARSFVTRAQDIPMPTMLRGRGCTFGSNYDNWALGIALNGEADGVSRDVSQLVRRSDAWRTALGSLLAVVEKVYLHIPLQSREALLFQAREIGSASGQSVKDTETAIAAALMSAGDSASALRLLSFESFATAEHLGRILQVVRPDVVARWRRSQSRITKGRVR